MKGPPLLLRVIERFILALPRRRMRRASAQKLRATLGALKECAATRTKLAKYDMPHVLRLYDASQFCLMYTADLTVLTRDMTCRANWWESKLYGRLLAMTMLECVEDIPTVLGREFRDSLAATVADDIHRQRISKFSKSLSDFRKRHENELRHIRTVTAAHRDHDAILQVAVIENLDTRELMRMAGELNDLSGAFAQAMTQVLLQMNVIKEILKSFSKKP
jgi:hypothetical protein